MFRRTVAMLALVPMLLAASPVHAQATGCQFVLGFATLHGMIAAATGDCTQDQHFALNGDALQETTRGLMVWRKADNWTAFTDGYHTWINGPKGLQQRLNTERFPWEPPPPPPRTAPAGALALPCFTTASGDCLHADPSVVPALTVLKTLTYGQWEENVAAQFGVPVALGDLSPSLLGSTLPETRSWCCRHKRSMPRVIICHPICSPR